MRLYHGTNEAIARAALTDGLKPRCETGSKSHWSECPSREDLVYLTAAYAGYFAMHATENLDPWGIVEIETTLLPGACVPDEDWLEQVTRNATYVPHEYENLSMQERTAFWRERLEDMAPLWLDSLEGLGNCAHVGAIPPEAVTRVSIYKPSSNAFFTQAVMDPTISIPNYQFCGSKYRAITKWLMKEPITVADCLGFGGATEHLMPASAIQAIQGAIDNQEGIEILP